MSDIPRKNEWRTFLEPALLLVGSIATIALLAEIFLRLFLWNDASSRFLASKSTTTSPQIVKNPLLNEIVRKSEDDRIVYELRPNLQGEFLSKQFSTNSHGMREREISVEKPDGVVRIVGIGDSVLFGWGVHDEETYLRQAEVVLNSASPSVRYETLNFGVPGYNTAIEVEVFKKRALQFDPDVVVLHFVNNDWTVPAFLERPRSIFSTSDSALAEVIRNTLARMKSAKTLSDADLVGFDMAGLSRQERSSVLREYRDMVGPRGFRRAVTELWKVARERQIPVIIVYGRTTGPQERLLQKVQQKFGFCLAPVRPAVEKFFAVQPQQLDPEARKSLLMVSSNDSHPNALGHKLYSEVLVEAIANRSNCLPKEPRKARRRKRQAVSD